MMQYLTKALLAACWFMLLTFPVMGIKLNSVDQTVEWQFDRVILLGVAIFFLSMLWNWCFSRKARGIPLIRLPEGLGKGLHSLVTLPNRNTTTRLTSLGLLLAVMIVMPLVSSFYQTNIMISAMLYVILALGLNIAVGIAGQLVLGYVAFYAVGAYSYALLNQAFGLGFWACLPVGGFMAIVFGLALGFPVLRLRGDYLAIVTLGFGEIVRLVLLNWTSLTGGSGGIKNIPGPSFFGQELEIAAIGGSQLAGEIGAISAEHLIVCPPEGIRSLAAGGAVACCLPATSFYLGAAYAPTREMIGAGVPVAVATDFNPGSCPGSSLQLAMNIACLKYRMTPEEVLTAVTLNAAAAIGRAGTIGSVEPGKQADLLLWNAPDLDYVCYRFGSNLVGTVMKKGRIVHEE